jgi:DNA-binding LytR/AlgR family response regulator
LKLLCIIIEDEPLATEKLECFITKTPSLKLLESFDNAIKGMNFIQENYVDIIFLDIQMKNLTGIQFLETITQKPHIIITSAYAEYALKGYELNVTDYLLKPYGYDRFLKAVNKVIDLSAQQRSSITEPTHIFIKTEYRLENVCIKEILYIEGMKEYLRIVLPDRKVMTKLSFKNLLDQLPENKFIRVHKSWVVQLNKIDSIERNRILIGETIIPIGNTFKNAFKDITN